MNLRCDQQNKLMLSQTNNEPAWVYSCGGPIISVDTTFNCELIVAGSVDKKLSLISKQGDLLWEKILDEEVWAVAIADVAKFVIAGTARKNPPHGSIYIFSNSGQELFKYSIDSPVWSVSTSDDARVIVASSWKNFAFRFESINGKFELTKKGRFGNHGLYGIKTSKNGSKTILAAPEHGIYVLGNNFKPVNGGKIKLKNGLYNIDIGHDGEKIVAGCRDGKFFYVDNIGIKNGDYSTTLSDRPICGVALSEDGFLVAAGSFDGQLYLTNNKGKCFWKYQTYGEVWATSVSRDGAHICVGSGDRCLYFFNNKCTSSAIKELENLELFLAFIKSKNKLRKELAKALEIYSQYGLFEYGITRSRELLQEKIYTTEFEKIIFKFLEKNIQKFPDNYKLHRLLAVQAERLKRHDVAVYHNQIASYDKELYFDAMLSSGINFQKLGLSSAARSCFRRAAAQSLDYSSMSILYNLARSYEDTENWEEATVLYEVLVSWDIHFRNSWERLRDIKERKSKDSAVDYTGVTVSLLGVDSPRQYNISDELSHITKSRSKELNIDEAKDIKLVKVFKNLEKDYKLPLALQKNKSLEYNEITYLKYDYLPSEDEIKKQLEMVYEFLVLEGKKKLINTLDIGAATGRHPMLMASNGKRAIGIDIEARAMQYANKMKKQTKSHDEYPFYCVGDSQYLPFSESTFDLVTCMMGTFAHIGPTKKIDMLKEVYRVMNPKGILIVSTWDIECNHLSYLSIYTEKDKRAITEKSIPKYETRILFEQAGFKKIDIIPFVMIPNVFIYELNIHNLELSDLKRAVKIDTSARSLYPTMSGEMFMVVGTK